MDIRYLHPNWGSENLSIAYWLQVALTNGFQGVEINLPEGPDAFEAFTDAIDPIGEQDPNLVLVLQQGFGVECERPQADLPKVSARLEQLVAFQPNFINLHTGKDSAPQNWRRPFLISKRKLLKRFPLYQWGKPSYEK
ncbi:MAG: hypothetical protein AAFV80_15225 [Bacteroidota bacterium]